jgi:hypothetical protein
MSTKSPKNSRPCPAGTLVQIVLRKHFARLDADVAHLLRPLLAPAVPFFRQGGRRGHQRRQAITPCFEVDGTGGIVTLAGLVPRIVDHLQASGYAVHVCDETVWLTLKAADDSRLAIAAGHPEDQHLLRAVAASPRGQLLVRGEGDVARVIAAIGTLLPRARMLVVASTQREVQSVHRRLGRVADRPVTMDMAEAWRVANRLMVCTASLFTCASGDDWDVVIFCGAGAVLAQQSFRRALRLDDQLRYAIVQSFQRLGPHARLQMEAACGPEIYRAGNPAAGAATVQVLFVPSPASGIPTRGMYLAGKRLGIWCNDERNDVIAALATAIARGDTIALEQWGLRPASIAPHLPRGNERASIVILVESTEHAQQLLGRLPGWEIKAAVPQNIGTKDAPSLPPVAGKSIVTVLYAEQHGIDADIVIRGDGGSQWPLSQVVLQPQGQQDRDEVVIIDFVAASDGNDRGRLQQRARDYQRHGWKVGNIVPNPMSPNGPVLAELGEAVRPK